MAIHLHQILNCIKRRVLSFIRLALNTCLHKVRSHLMLRAQLLAKIGNTEVIRPHLTMCPLNSLVLVRTLELHAEAVDHAWTWGWDLLILGHAADPFSAIAETSDALHFEGTGPGGGKEVPDRIWVLEVGSSGVCWESMRPLMLAIAVWGANEEKLAIGQRSRLGTRSEISWISTYNGMSAVSGQSFNI